MWSCKCTRRCWGYEWRRPRSARDISADWTHCGCKWPLYSTHNDHCSWGGKIRKKMIRYSDLIIVAQFTIKKNHNIKLIQNMTVFLGFICVLDDTGVAFKNAHFFCSTLQHAISHVWSWSTLQAGFLEFKSFVVHHNLHTVESKVEIDRKSVPFRYFTRTASETSLIGHCVHSLNRYDCDWHQWSPLLTFDMLFYVGTFDNTDSWWPGVPMCDPFHLMCILNGYIWI